MICKDTKSTIIASFLTVILITSGMILIIFNVIAEENIGSRAVGFTESSTGLPPDGGYNYIALGDFNDDGNIDIASGGENYGGGINTVGLYAYTGDGGSSWTSASDGLPTEYAWGGLQLVDADGDSFMELYAADEHWGASSNLGLKVYEYRDSSWTDSPLHVSTPLPAGTPNNVVIKDITGDDKLDMVVALRKGIQYFENQGSNPAVWLDRSTGLATGGEFTAIAVEDVNDDDLLDIVASDYSTNEYLYIQSSAGNLWQANSDGLSSPGNTLGIAVGDVNDDGHMDIIFGSRDNGLRCWLGDSAGGSGGTTFTWTEANSALPTSGRYPQIQLADIDSDLDLDLIAPEGNSNKGIQIFLGNGNTKPGTSMEWTEASSTGLPTTGNYYGCNVYDINDDGSLDIVGASWGSGLGAWLSSGGGPVIPTDDTPPAVVTDLTVIEETENSIKLTWTAPGDDGFTGTASEYDLRYAEKEITAANWNAAIRISGLQTPKPPSATENVNVTGLDQNTTYYFALKTYDEVPNESPISNSPSGKTLGVSKPHLDVTITPAKWILKPGEDLDIDVVVKSKSDQLPLASATVNVSTETDNVVLNPVTGQTDSQGQFELSVSPPDVTESTQMVLIFDITKEDYKSNHQRITITINPPDVDKFNLRITNGDITFSPANIIDGDEVRISAAISNNGESDADAFTVKFYVDSTELTTDSVGSLKMGSTVTAEASWTASEGTHNIRVDILPTDTSMDSDSSDNSVTVSISVSAEEDEKGAGDEAGFPWWILLLIIIIVAIIFALAYMSKKKDRGNDQ